MEIALLPEVSARPRVGYGQLVDLAGNHHRPHLPGSVGIGIQVVCRFISSACSSVFAGFFFIDKKQFFLSLLVLALPVIIHINFYYQPSEISRSTYGFQILLFDIPLLALYILWLSRAILNREPLAINTTGLLPLAGLFFSASISILLSVQSTLWRL